MERKFIKSGIPGLDKVLGGGFLQGSIVTVSGPTGSGKSTLATQFLYNGAKEENENGLYIAIEESRQDFYFHLGGYNWDLQSLEKERKFILLDYPIYEVEQILNQYSAIQEIINTTGVKRVVIDSIMPIALYFQNDDERKKGFLKFMENIRKWNVTTLIVSEDLRGTDIESFPDSQYGIETFTDGWVNLFYHYDKKGEERTRMLEVLKMKGVQHSSKAYPVRIDSKGISLIEGTEQAQAPKTPEPVAVQGPSAVPKPSKGGRALAKTRLKEPPSAPAPKPAATAEQKASIAARIAAAKARLVKKTKGR